MSRKHELVFQIPAAYVLERALPKGDELLYGLRHGWLSRRDFESLVRARLRATSHLDALDKELVHAIERDPGHVDELVYEAEQSDAYPDGGDRLWLFLALAWILDRPVSVDQKRALEMVYADFDYPQDIAAFIPFTPGTDSNWTELETKWRHYVEGRSAHYARRR